MILCTYIILRTNSSESTMESVRNINCNTSIYYIYVQVVLTTHYSSFLVGFPVWDRMAPGLRQDGSRAVVSQQPTVCHLLCHMAQSIH